MRSGTERKSRAARGAGTADPTITKRALYYFHHHDAFRRPSDFGINAGWVTLQYCRLHRGTIVSAGCHCFARASKAGARVSSDARRAAPVDRVCESGPRRGRDLARVRVLNEPSGGVRPAQHTTACVGYQWTSNFLWT